MEISPTRSPPPLWESYRSCESGFSHGLDGTNVDASRITAGVSTRSLLSESISLRSTGSESIVNKPSSHGTFSADLPFRPTPSLSYSKYLKVLEPYFEKNTPGFNDNRSTMREILQKDNDLAEIVQLVGKSALSEADKVTLEVATMIKVSRDEYYTR